MLKFKKYVFVIGLIGLIASCATNSFSGGDSSKPLNANDARGVNQVIDDQNIKVAIYNQISANISLANIDVTVYNKYVLLTGQAPNLDTKNRVNSFAQGQSGVKKIFNYIDVTPNISPDQAGNDIMITSKVKTKILLEAGIPSNDIKVVTSNSVVYLMGIVTPAVARLTANVASSVPDVTKVVTVFEYIQ